MNERLAELYDTRAAVRSLADSGSEKVAGIIESLIGRTGLQQSPFGAVGLGLLGQLGSYQLRPSGSYMPRYLSAEKALNPGAAWDTTLDTLRFMSGMPSPQLF